MTLQSTAEALFRKCFGGEPVVLGRAPGRIEFIGNHTDYNCGTVIGASIDRMTIVAARARDDGKFSFVSEQSGGSVMTVGRPFVRQHGPAAWTNYLVGVIVALEKRGLPPLAGLEVAVVSDLPGGAGLSSSAALELATALALRVLQRFDLSREETVKACREAENEFVGVPSGILDQTVSGFGRRDHLVHIDCRRLDVALIPLPPKVRFWIFNTHEKHALVDSLYATRHGECMEAARLIGTLHPAVRWLADVTMGQLHSAESLLPENVGRRARHVVEEIARVGAMREALAATDLAAAGRLLYASHESSRALFENSTRELDFLVDALRGRPGVHGARLTGGGFGGAVMAMTSPPFDTLAAAHIAADYAAEFGTQPDILTCTTGDGAQVLRG